MSRDSYQRLGDSNGGVSMKLGRVIPLCVLFLILSSVIAFAKVEGKWESTKNSCNCNAFLIITRWEDGSPIGTMTCAGAPKRHVQPHCGWRPYFVFRRPTGSLPNRYL